MFKSRVFRAFISRSVGVLALAAACLAFAAPVSDEQARTAAAAWLAAEQAPLGVPLNDTTGTPLPLQAEGTGTVLAYVMDLADRKSVV